jgi:hypothetical protein
MYDDEDLSFLHDEDSDNPNSIQDEEPEEDDEDAFVREIIQGTLSELEKAVGEIETAKETVTVNRATALKALQLLKAYTTLYEISYEDYIYRYD